MEQALTVWLSASCSQTHYAHLLSSGPTLSTADSACSKNCSAGFRVRIRKKWEFRRWSFLSLASSFVRRFLL